MTHPALFLLAILLVLCRSLSYLTAAEPGGYAPPKPKDLIHIFGEKRPVDLLSPTDLLVVTTLDGALHGIHRPTGRVLWTREDDGWGPLVSVRDIAAEARAAALEEAMTGEFKNAEPLSPPVDAELELPDSDDVVLLAEEIDGSETGGSQGVWIPEPTGNGDLYFYEPGKSIQKLRLPIKRIVDDNHAFMFGDFVFTGKKITRLVALNPFNGQTLQRYGGDSQGDEELSPVAINDRDAVFIGRTQYLLSAWDKKTSKLRWNITYGEFSAPNSPNFHAEGVWGEASDLKVIPPPDSGKVEMTSDAEGFITFKGRDNDLPIRMQFESPAVGAFHIGPHLEGYHVEKIYPPATTPTRSLSTETRTDAYVGHHKGSFYILSSKNYPDIAAASASLLPSVPASELSRCRMSLSPECLVGSHTVYEPKTRFAKMKELGMRAGETMGEGQWIWGWVRVVVGLVSLVAGLYKWGMSMFRQRWSPPGILAQTNALATLSNLQDSLSARTPITLPTTAELGQLVEKDSVSVSMEPAHPSPVSTSTTKKKKKSTKTVKLQSPDVEVDQSTISSADSPADRPPLVDEKASVLGHTKLSSIEVTQEVLGYGSHGTVVYKGSFEGRDVAVKRLLLDFYDVADHEVRMLQESDDHPNVIRYYFRETSQGFMYIALELCPASLHDIIEKSTNKPDYHALRIRLKPTQVLFQIVQGLHHLHALKIVHRDIKPQNILIALSKAKGKNAHDAHPRILISDFGLGKRLADDQSSFHHTHHTAGGTVGWRAAECMLAQNSFPASTDGASSSSSSSSSSGPNPANSDVKQNAVRITKSIDIFSAGCTFYYILTGGAHPFGDKFVREVNILKGNFRLDKLDAMGEEGYEAKDLIKRMIAKDPAKRPTTSQLLTHPYFWTPSQRLNFLADASDRLEIEPRDPPSPLLKTLERLAPKVVGPDWYRRIDRALLDNLGKYRKYEGALVRDLLRVVRNKKHHYQDLPPDVQQSLGSLPEGFVTYFTSRFPALLLHVYNVVADTKLCNEAMFKVYFEVRH